MIYYFCLNINKVTKSENTIKKVFCKTFKKTQILMYIKNIKDLIENIYKKIKLIIDIEKQHTKY